MKMKTKQILALLFSLLLAAVMIACGKTSESSVVGEQNIAVTPAASAAAPAAAEPAAAPTAAPVEVTPIPTTAPTPSPAPAPAAGPAITKQPTGETVTEGGTVIFIAKADAYDSVAWQLIGPDGSLLTGSEIGTRFPTLLPEGMDSETLYLRYAPAELSGWSARAVFTKNGVSTCSDAASIRVAGFFTQIPHDYTFSSGAGAWATELNLNDDGSFTGVFHDWDGTNSMDDSDYSQVYTCTFTGRFGNPRKIDGYSYSITLEELDYETGDPYKSDTDRMWYIPSYPYGLTDCSTFIVYLPGAPASSLTDEIIYWTHMGDAEALGGYAIYNTAEEYTFISGES